MKGCLKMAKSKKKRTRGKYGEGSTYQMKNGKWAAAASLGIDDVTGKRRREVHTGFNTNEEAEAYIANMLDEKDLIEKPPVADIKAIDENTLVKDFVDEFLRRDINSNNNRTSRTRNNYENCMKHYKDNFSNKPIKSITAGDLKDFFQYIANTYSDSVVKKEFWLVKSLYIWAYEHEYINKNPFDSHYLKRPNSTKESIAIQSYSKEEHKSIMKALNDKKYLYIIIRFMWETGVRTEEAIALLWKDINFEEQYVHINRAITLEYMSDDNGHTHSKSVVGKTKTTKSNRVIGLSNELVRLLLEWKDEAPNVSKTKTSEEDFVFGNTRHERWGCSGLRTSLNRYLASHSEDLKKLRLHRIRHSSAMAMAKGGLPLIDIMNTLGHSKPDTTKVYFDLVADKVDTESLKKRIDCLHKAGIIDSEE
jgi:integrase